MDVSDGVKVSFIPDSSSIERIGSLADQSKDDGDASTRTAARVRDNQRRARQRHKAYVEDLRRRVQEYDQRGIQATMEMQQAARTVAIENSRLRLLLRRRGVADDEVDEFLQSFSEEDHPEEASRPNRAKSRPSSGKCLSQGDGYNSSDKLAALADASMQQDCCGGKTQCTMTSDELGAIGTSAQVFPSHGRNTLDTSCGASPVDVSSPTTMSCTEAAKIVAEMQGYGDSDMAKAALGCGSRRECIVKNTSLFQILEGSGDGL